jgi:hypothetical protein
VAATTIEVWEVWYPKAAATGMSFARGRLDATDTMLIHSAPETIDVDVVGDDGTLIARGKGLEQTADRPMARLRKVGDRVEREDLWPEPSDVGKPVILPGGEVGILLDWWNAEDGSEWRWSVEFYNHR